MEDYFYSLISQVDLSSSAKGPDIETHIALRSETIGVKIYLAFTELVPPRRQRLLQQTEERLADQLCVRLRFAHALDITVEVFEHPSIRKIKVLAAELILL